MCAMSGESMKGRGKEKGQKGQNKINNKQTKLQTTNKEAPARHAAKPSRQEGRGKGTMWVVEGGGNVIWGNVVGWGKRGRGQWG